MSRSPPLRDRLDKQAFEKLYSYDRLSTVEIAQRYGSSLANVLELMEEYGIDRKGCDKLR